MREVDNIPMRDSARQVPHKAMSDLRITRPDMGTPVSAWLVDGRGRDVQVDGLAIAWTSRTVLVVYFDEHGRRGVVWLWASAVTRRQD